MQEATVTDTTTQGVPLVEMRDIRVSFGGIHAVDGVTVPWASNSSLAAWVPTS